MMLSKPPQLDRRFVAITTNEQVAIAAVVSSYVRQPGLYFAFFEFPSVKYPHQSSTAFERDGYLARAMGDRATHQINNALAHIQPERILLLGLTDIEKSYLKAILPHQKLVEIDTLNEVPGRLPFKHTNREELMCKRSQVIEGLLHANGSGKYLTIDEAAPDLPIRKLVGGKAILVLENDCDAHDVAAVNYASCLDVDVVLVPPIPGDEIEALPRQLAEWSKNNSHPEYQKLKRRAFLGLKGTDFTKYEFATFFTHGLPYGLFIKNAIPCTHVLKNIDCGLFIANNLIEEHNTDGFGAALLFSPEFFESEEINDLVAVLGQNNYTVKLLRSKGASVRNLSFYGGYYPYDILHICSHGGETDGYFVIQEFKDRVGASHKLEFFEVVGFAPTGGDNVVVHRKLIFKSLDGLVWRSAPLKDYPSYVFEDMMRATKADSHEGLTRVPFNSPIGLSCHIKCYQSIHQGHFNCLGGLGHPIVFNNTCSSSHELDAMIINAGARAYLGTLWSIGTASATNAAKAFYDEAIRGGKLLAAFVAANNCLKGSKYQNIYIYWGLHFSSFRTPRSKSDAKQLEALVREFSLWLKNIATTKDTEVKRNSIPIAKFLLEVITSNFAPDRVAEVVGLDRTAIEEEERSLPPESEDSIRGVSELDLPTSSPSDCEETQRTVEPDL